MKKLLEYLLFPPRCVGCGRRFNIFRENCETVFCPDCRAAWERAKMSPCPSCGLPILDCTCVSAALAKRNMALVSLVKYETSLAPDGALAGKSGATRLILRMKQTRNAKAFAFSAEELSRRLSVWEARSGIDLSEAVVTFVPRKKRSVAMYGFDHAKEIARRLAKLRGLPCEALLFRLHGGKDQKELNKKERQKNVQGKYGIQDKDLSGRTVILVDDVMTTGATLTACADLLWQAGAERVLAATLARTEASGRRKA